MSKIKILWVDDEIDLLKPHILFLEKKNYEVTKCQSGTEALDILDEYLDLVELPPTGSGYYEQTFSRAVGDSARLT